MNRSGEPETDWGEGGNYSCATNNAKEEMWTTFRHISDIQSHSLFQYSGVTGKAVHLLLDNLRNWSVSHLNL